MSDGAPSTDVIQGTLDMLILKALSLEPMHGFGIARRIEQTSRGVFKVNPGLAADRVPAARAGRPGRRRMAPDRKRRRAKYYTLTAAGRRQLEVETARLGAARRGGGAAAQGGGRVAPMSTLAAAGSRGLPRAHPPRRGRSRARRRAAPLPRRGDRAARRARRSLRTTARRAARREIGGPIAVREQVRDHGWEHGSRRGCRTCGSPAGCCARRRSSRVVVVLVIALGSGAVTTIFSAMNAAVLRPVPGVAEPARLVTVRLVAPRRRHRGGAGLAIGTTSTFASARAPLAGVAAWGRVTAHHRRPAAQAPPCSGIW